MLREHPNWTNLWRSYVHIAVAFTVLLGWAQERGIAVAQETGTKDCVGYGIFYRLNCDGSREEGTVRLNFVGWSKLGRPVFAVDVGSEAEEEETAWTSEDHGLQESTEASPSPTDVALVNLLRKAIILRAAKERISGIQDGETARKRAATDVYRDYKLKTLFRWGE